MKVVFNIYKNKPGLSYSKRKAVTHIEKPQRRGLEVEDENCKKKIIKDFDDIILE